jgi:hypothetical protein
MSFWGGLRQACIAHTRVAVRSGATSAQTAGVARFKPDKIGGISRISDKTVSVANGLSLPSDLSDALFFEQNGFPPNTISPRDTALILLTRIYR